ncbi:hypothetical protein [Actinosynnema sp.]|uniref:hypothetical protein n=1 Tax=Actinosynnema sp. TaxID=1872144 RepID=UPI003F871D8C
MTDDTDWSTLEHAYGRADDIPPMLEKLATDPDADTWSELWGSIYHQGSTYSASVAALPHLARIAELRPDAALDAVVLAGRISAAEWPDVEDEHPRALESLRATATAQLAAGGPDDDFAVALQALLGLGRAPEWGEDAFDGVIGGGCCVACPSCGTDLDVRFPSSTGTGWEGVDTVPEPATEFDGVAAWLRGEALRAGRAGVAATLAELFGTIACDECGERFALAAALTGLEGDEEED